MGDGVYTIENAVLVVVGVLVIAGGSVLLRHRVAAMRLIVSANRRLYGSRLADRMERQGHLVGVALPAVGFVVFGCVFVLAGAFDWID